LASQRVRRKQPRATIAPFKFRSGVPIRGSQVPRLTSILSALFVPATIVAGALVCAHSIADLLAQPLSTEWLVLLALTAGSGWVTLRLPAMPISISFADTFILLTAVLIGPSAGAVTAAIDAVVQSARMGNRSARRGLFNVASLSCTTWIAGQAYLALGGSEPAVAGAFGALRLLTSMMVFGLLFLALNSGWVAVAVALERRKPIVEVWRTTFSSLWMSAFGGTFSAMLMVVLAHQSAVEIVIVMAPLPVLLYVAMRHALGRAADQIDHLAKMNRVYVATIEALAQAVDAKDQVTHDHVRRVQEKSLQLAERLGVRDEGQLQALKAAGLLHDVGKIGIPEHILNKPGKLTASEFEIMKRHPAIGADILSVIGFPYPLIPIVRHHHESWDGTGYPDRLAGEDIPIGARILQVVDCFDALTSDRPYRRAMSDHDALKIVTDRRGTMYDPRVVDALLELHAAAPAAVTGDAQGEPQPVSDSANRQTLRLCETTPRESAAATRARAARDVLEVIADLSGAVAAERSPVSVGEALWNGLREELPAAAFVLFTCEAQALVPVYRSGAPTVASHTRIAVGERLSGWVAATRRSIVNSDARLDFEADVRDTTTLCATLAVPVERDGETLAVLAFYADRENAFDESHQRLVEAAAYITATTLYQPMAPQLIGARPTQATQATSAHAVAV
jgi:putative nucleotidyltransferase with HDIG domain